MVEGGENGFYWVNLQIKEINTEGERVVGIYAFIPTLDLGNIRVPLSIDSIPLDMLSSLRVGRHYQAYVEGNSYPESNLIVSKIEPFSLDGFLEKLR